MSWLANALNSIINGVGDFFSDVGSTVRSWFSHSGGIAPSGGDPAAAGILQMLGAPQFATGGMVVSTPGDAVRLAAMGLPMIKDDVPALLQAGEAVLNRAATSRLGEDVINALNAGATLGQPVNVNVGITPNEGGVGSLAAALLPMLMGAVDISVASGNKVERSTRLIGYKPIKGA